MLSPSLRPTSFAGPDQPGYRRCAGRGSRMAISEALGWMYPIVIFDAPGQNQTPTAAWSREPRPSTWPSASAGTASARFSASGFADNEGAQNLAVCDERAEELRGSGHPHRRRGWAQGFLTPSRQPFLMLQCKPASFTWSAIPWLHLEDPRQAVTADRLIWRQQRSGCRRRPDALRKNGPEIPR